MNEKQLDILTLWLKEHIFMNNKIGSDNAFDELLKSEG